MLLLAEPTSALDAQAREDVRRLLPELVERAPGERPLTLVTVTHDLGLAERLADEVCVLEQGKLARHG